MNCKWAKPSMHTIAKNYQEKELLKSILVRILRLGHTFAVCVSTYYIYEWRMMKKKSNIYGLVFSIIEQTSNILK